MIISVSGTIGSGKDTIADYLVTQHKFKRISFAASLKDAVSLIFGWDREMLEGTTKTSREWREQVDVWWAERLGIPHLTPRWALQYWGTEVARNGFHNDIWVASLENKQRNTKDDIVITVRVERGQQPEWYEAAANFNKGPDANPMWALSKLQLEKFKIHASEYSSVGLDYDHVIHNNGTIDDLHQKIRQVIENS